MGAALLALVGYVAINSSSPFQNAVSTDVPSSHYSVVPTLGHGHHAKKSADEEETELLMKDVVSSYATLTPAYQVTPYVGFRTFVQGVRGGHKTKEDGVSFLMEPFSPLNSKVEGVEDESKPDRTIYTKVNYFVMPEEDFAALVRRTTITNTGDDDLTLSALDGLAKVEPTGGRLQWGLKNIGRTLEGWMGVYHANDDLGLPFYRMSTEPSDTASCDFDFRLWKAENIKDLPKIAKIVTKKNFITGKFQRARDMMNELTSKVETHTASKLFDGTIKQNYLDNSLRGGMPVILGELDDEARSSNADEDSRLKVYHVFSRIHGDLERDYNDFNIDPTYFSQGPGNYRDVAQNRRNDVVFSPRIGSFVVKQFLSFIQADGYEPLTVQAYAYQIENHNEASRVASLISSEEISKQRAIDEIMAIATESPMALYGSGYWADHWEYYLDLIEAYTSIYPDGEESLMYDTELRYFFSTATVKPRSQKYVEDYTFDGKSKHILQLDATVFDNDKVKEQEAFRNVTTGLVANEANWQRTGGPGNGRAFTSPAITKLFLLGVMKFSMRDAYGMGVEYEGGRPGWNDAMNGLAGMVGSGMPETFELSELLKYVLSVVKKFQRPLVVPSELADMVDTVNDALDELLASGYEDSEELTSDVPKELFKYWDTVASARESYRNEVQYYFSGDTVEIAAEDAIDMLTKWFDQVQLGVARSMKIGSKGIDDDGTSGLPPSYFSYNITKWKRTHEKNDKGLPLVNAEAMAVGVFPLFLEAPTRYMKLIVDDQDKMVDMYDKVLNSGLRDDQLKMYFLSADLTGQSYDMGRMMAFAAGWLENHLFGCTCLTIPFHLETDVYWSQPYVMNDDGDVEMQLIPALPMWLFEDKETAGGEGKRDEDGNLVVSYKLFASIMVTYHNTLGTDLFEVEPTSYIVTMTDGSTVEVEGSKIPTETAVKIRKLLGVETIDVYF
ncbi:hypothetical protein QTG54_011780 [Skeletonema marinoi]|uniref:Uncharacterized protein n=1 Tax=Skeletonema marinoi TaxID=267567 RepID=A0AAD8Y1I6_9STRA|nr:hypothetical protein QTG54_011780 [Skeletonema marinoi]